VSDIDLHMLIMVCVSVVSFQGKSFPLLGERGFSDVINEGILMLVSVGSCRVGDSNLDDGGMLDGCDGMVSQVVLAFFFSHLILGSFKL